MKKINPMNTIKLPTLLFTVYCLLFTLFSGCASLQHKESVLAVVDGDPITKGDLEYSLTVAHRKEDLSSAGGLKLSEYVEKLVDDRLIADEARRSGMDQYPEIKRAVEAFILRESVVRLYDEEIVSKVSVTDEEIREFYGKNYERFNLGIIEVTDEETAEDIVKRLRQGEDFGEIAGKYSVHISRENGGTVVYNRNALPEYFMEVIDQLQPGGISDSIHVLNKYYIVKYYGREDAPWGEEFDKIRGRIESAIRKQKEKERSDEYLDYLRKKASIRINEELLSSIELGGSAEELKKWAEDKNPLVEIDHEVLSAGDFVSMARPSTRRTKEDILNSWIDRKLVDLEALGRNYQNGPELKRMTYRYENKLLKDMYIKSVIVPRVHLTDEMAEEYYSANQHLFMTPARYNIQQITVKEPEEAEVIFGNLEKGADFSWWARSKSIDPAATEGGNAGWFVKQELPEPISKIIETMNPGDISPVLEADTGYMIVRLKEKIDEKVRPYEEVKSVVYRSCFNEQLKKIYNEYVDRLKVDADIVVYENEIALLEEEFFK